MISNRRNACHVRRRRAGVDLAAGVVVAAAMFGAAAAPAARADSPPPADPISLLDSAQTELTDANQVLSQIPTQGNLDLATAVAQQTGFQDMLLQNLGHVESAESVILSHAGSFSALIDQFWFTPVDQGWLNETETVFAADQALAAAAASGSGLQAADFGEAAAAIQSLPLVFNDFPIEELAVFLSQL